MMQEALSKFIDELFEGKDPTISGILRDHPVGRDEFAALVRTAALTHGALSSIPVPADAEAESRARAIQYMEQNPKPASSNITSTPPEQEGLIERIRALLRERFGVE